MVVMVFKFSNCFFSGYFVLRRISLCTYKLHSNHYQVLGVRKNATSDEIKKAYLQKCKDYHPDKHMGSKAMQEKFVEVSRAYGVLSDVEKRRIYDSKFKTVNQQSRYQSHSDYRWGSEARQTRATPEDVFREYQKHNSRQRYRGRYSGHTSDPLEEYWESVYRNPNSTRDHGPFSRNDFRKASGFRASGNFNEENPYDPNRDIRLVVILFFCFILLILYVRIKIATKSLQNNPTDPYYSHSRKYDNYSAKRQSDIDDLNIKTEDA